MTTHFGRTWDGELVTVSDIITRNGSYYAVFTDSNGVENQASMGKTTQSTQSQVLCEKLGLMPYCDDYAEYYPFQAVLKQWGSGNSYIIGGVLVGDDLAKCKPTKEIEKGQYLLHDGNWCRIRNISTGQADGGKKCIIDITDTSRSDPAFYDISVTKYATAWCIVRDGLSEQTESRIA